MVERNEATKERIRLMDERRKEQTQAEMEQRVKITELLRLKQREHQHNFTVKRKA
jgi:hypothetical protein